ncbi:MAG: FecR family protein [Prolixibacteraceae bacterium]|jgi:ferric-dicitrate binding protein FerR (iron transport regulator)|nr:FecR family protein [Prolixibacteraceae bacterium]
MTKDLFIKYLQGNCSEQEFDRLILWIRKGVVTGPEKKEIEEIWEEFDPGVNTYGRDKYNQILDKIHHKINVNQYPGHRAVRQQPFRSRMLAILTRAAAILLIPVLSLFIYTYFFGKNYHANNLNDIEIESPAGSRMNFELSDGTKVWLNHGSRLKYPYRFNTGERKVFLTGEAYFVVAKNKKSPFIVSTDRLDVKATGTTFNVSAYPGETFVSTTLVEGKVILYDNRDARLIKELSPDECVQFDIRENKYFLDSGNTEKYTGWKDGVLLFKNDPVEEIARKLARWYNIEVEITDEKAKEYTCTATFSDETITQALELLSLPTPVRYNLVPRMKLPDGSFSKQKVQIGLKN